MRALRITGPGVAELVTVPDPVITTPTGATTTTTGASSPTSASSTTSTTGAMADEVLVTVGTAAICNTDRKLVRRGEPLGRTPGHEVAGRLEDGTAVGVHPDVGCGACRHCQLGQTNRCPDRGSIGVSRDGGLAERVVVPRAHAVPLDGIPVELAPLLEPLACGIHAAHRLGTFEGPAVVVGAGAMGIVTMWALQALGHEVVVVQRSEARRRQASRLGADEAIGPDRSLAEVSGAVPAAVVVTAPGEQPLRWALDNVAEGGVVHAFAGTPGGAPIDANLVHYRHLDLVGSTGSGLRDYIEARDLVRRGAVPLDRLPRARTDLDGAVAAVTSPGSDEHLRVMVDIGS